MVSKFIFSQPRVIRYSRNLNIFQGHQLWMCRSAHAASLMHNQQALCIFWFLAHTCAFSGSLHIHVHFYVFPGDFPIAYLWVGGRGNENHIRIELITLRRYHMVKQSLLPRCACVVESKTRSENQSIVQSIVQSRVQSPGFTPTLYTST